MTPFEHSCPCTTIHDVVPRCTAIMDNNTRLRISARASRRHLFALLLLLLTGVETNLGPAAPITFGALNVGGGSRKGAFTASIIYEHQLDILAVSETWIREDAPNAIKFDLAPEGFGIMHEHRRTVPGRPRKGEAWPSSTRLNCLSGDGRLLSDQPSSSCS